MIAQDSPFGNARAPGLGELFGTIAIGFQNKGIFLDKSEHRQALPPGHQLNAYRLIEVLGVGGFGVTYLAHDATLERRVAIKEYLPNEFAMRDGAAVHPKSRSDREDFRWGLERFLDEARALARFRHPNLVRVVEYFEANNTAYIVMDYEEGEPLDRLLDGHGTLSEAQLRGVLLPIVDGLEQVHAAGYLHRDVKPSNVYVRRSDETPVLLDFGAARQAVGRRSKSLTAVASAGYSPPEQYESEGEQGPWTDIYALSALCYRAITGEAPIEAPRRLDRLARGRADRLPRLAETGPDGYSMSFLGAVDRGLRVVETERPPALDEWMALVDDALPKGARVGVATGALTARGTGGVEQGRGHEQRSRGVRTGVGAAMVGAVLFVGGCGFNNFWPAPQTGPAPEKDSSGLPPGGTFSEDLRSGGDGPEMVVIPAGRFRMGCLSNDDACDAGEKPDHEDEVTIGRAFALSTREVTFAQWDGCVEGGGCGGHRPEDEGWGRGDRPVINVSWEDAQSYVAWLSRETGESYRLPSESEWEYAARAGTATKHSWGNEIGVNRANCDGCGSGWDDRQTAPVGSFAPSAYGLYDMHGNVSEWVEDCWNRSYVWAPVDGDAWESGECAKRVLRGGSSFSEPRDLRASGRGWVTSGVRDGSFGFRVARTLTP